MSEKLKLLAIIATSLCFSISASADEDVSAKRNVLNQKPYSSNQFPEHTIVINTKSHGTGTFTSYPSYQQRHRPSRHTENQNYNNYRQKKYSGVYTSPQASVSYYYSTPISNGEYVQIQSRHDINYNKAIPYDHTGVTPSAYTSRSLAPVNRLNFHQQYPVYPSYPTHSRQSIQPRPQCLGPNCGK